MQSASQPMTTHPDQEVSQSRTRSLWIVLGVAAGLFVLALVFYNLTLWPVTWFDEGSHLHVPKTLVTEGVYADRSSEGYRYFGPTQGVGPTVMLPIALVFRLAGIGLLQARLVMALYLLATIAAFYLLARRLGGLRFALIAVALLIAMRGGASTLQFGRQVLGEVPALFFLAAGLTVWFGAGERVAYGRLLLAGVLLGAAIVTKSQFLLAMGPGLLLAWLANMLYYRAAPQRFFIIPGVVTVAMVAAWQLYQVVYLGPSTWQENLALLRTASEGAAFVFSPRIMRLSLSLLLSVKIFLGLLVLFMGYGVLKSLPRSRQGMYWSVIVALISCNLAWYVFGSVGWIRYAHVGLALTTLCGAALFDDLLGLVHWDWQTWRRSLWSGQPLSPQTTVGLLGGALLAAMVVVPLALTTYDIVFTGSDGPADMGRSMNQLVPTDAIVETWEPEMGFLTNHNYHYPPYEMMMRMLKHATQGGPSPADGYSYVEEATPPYLLVGMFSRRSAIYERAVASGDYRLILTNGDYQLFEHAGKGTARRSEP